MTFLDDILRQKQSEIASLSTYDVPRSSKRSFITALRNKKLALIAEVKPRSPAKGDLINRSDVPSVVKNYNNHASAISVLCDNTFFGGGYDLLQEVRAMTTLPILAKEFIINRKQIDAADAAGADAVLLIAHILDAVKLLDLARYAIERNMAVLCEIHSNDEVAEIPDLPSDKLAIGINNRDLATLVINQKTVETLAPMVRSKFPDHLLIAESGYADVTSVDRASKTVDGFLIGTGLLKGSDAPKLLSFFSKS